MDYIINTVLADFIRKQKKTLLGDLYHTGEPGVLNFLVAELMLNVLFSYTFTSMFIKV